MPHYRTFQVKYHGPTDARSSRISIFDPRHGRRIFLPFDHRCANITEQAWKHLTAIGIAVEGFSRVFNDFDLIFSTDFATPLLREPIEEVKE